MALDEDMAGGFSDYYNPSFGLMMAQQHQHPMFAQHMAQQGAPIPPDFPEDFDHKDAHKILSQGAKDQSRAPGMGAASGLPQQGSFEERFTDAFNRNPPGLPYEDPYKGSLTAPRPPVKSPNDIPSLVTPPAWDSPPKSFTGKPMSTNQPPEPPKPLPPETTEIPSLGPGLGKFLKKPDEKPTPAADIPATTGGSTVPAPDTSEKTGGLNKEEPSAKTEGAKEKKKDEAWDGFGKALAGISAMKPPAVQFPHPGSIPHPGTQLSRSTGPTELLKELSQMGHPGQLVRLGAALKGR